MEQQVKDLQEQIDFLKDVIKLTTPNLDALFKDWKNEQGLFSSRELER